MERRPPSCCIVGGGPAGIMSGYLLARAGISVTVLEKHADFLRDFRGDTVHPSTLQIMDELGLYDRLLQQTHYEARELKGRVGGLETKVADFSHLATRAKFIAFMPQWDFLSFLSAEAKAYPCFDLRMETEAVQLIEVDGTVTGVRARAPQGACEFSAGLVIGCDGRHAISRTQSGLPVEDIGAPMDVLWFRISRRSGDPRDPLGTFGPGHILIMIDRGDYWQCGYIIAKGSLEKLKQRGLDGFRSELEKLAPFLQGRSSEVQDFDDLKLLTVGVDRMRKWHRPGLLCIGDAAHTMSPVGGVGINLAIQDAVAVANILSGPLKRSQVTDADLARVQSRREPPARWMQWLQVRIQEHVIKELLHTTGEPKPPLMLRALKRFPFLTRIPAHIIGLGFRPEHVDRAIFER